jgi:hypothetical protein
LWGLGGLDKWHSEDALQIREDRRCGINRAEVDKLVDVLIGGPDVAIIEEIANLTGQGIKAGVHPYRPRRLAPRGITTRKPASRRHRVGAAGFEADRK